MTESKIHAKEVHERRVRRIFNRHELESVLGNIVHHEIRDEFGPDVDVDAVDYKLTFEDETEGSPSYKVGTRCIVDVTERLNPSKAIKEEGNFLSTAVLENALDEADSFRYRVKVLEDALERVKSVVTYPCDTSIQARGYGTRSIDITGCEYIAEIIDLSLSKALSSQPQKGKSE